MARRKGFFAPVDDHTLARAQRGNREALEALYRTFSVPVHNLAWRLGGDRDEAEEVLQETFLEVVRSLRSFRGDAPLGAWIRRIAVSKVVSRQRRARVRRGEVELMEGSGSAGGAVPAHEPVWSGGVARFDLERALSTLSQTSRAVVWLHDVEGLTHAEIGAIFDRSASFSKSQLARAHSKLRSWLVDAWRTNDASDDRAVAGVSGR
jgi:RNA polymerase sigma-70 factor (ECF subfamily)